MLTQYWAFSSVNNPAATLVGSERALPLVIAVVRIETVSANVIAKRVTHPAEAFAFGSLGRGRGGPELGFLETLGDCVDVEAEIVGEEAADFGVFVVALEGPGVLRGGCVDVYVDA